MQFTITTDEPIQFTVSCDSSASFTVNETVPVAVTVAVFRDGVDGEKGDTGNTGAQGIQGLKGDKGDTGDKGDIGNTGAQGIQGLKGDKGDTGNTGAQGIQGAPGPAGSDATVPSATSSVEGKMKLFSAVGSAADGTMTQAAITAELALKSGKATTETFIYSRCNETVGTHTGNASETVVRTIIFNANEFVASDFLTLLFDFEKTGSGACTARLRLGINGTTADALIATAISGTATSWSINRKRAHFLTGNLLKIMSPTTNQVSDVSIATTLGASVAVNPTVSLRLSLTFQLVTTTDVATCFSGRVGKIKTI